MTWLLHLFLVCVQVFPFIIQTSGLPPQNLWEPSRSSYFANKQPLPLRRFSSINEANVSTLHYQMNTLPPLANISIIMLSLIFRNNHHCSIYPPTMIHILTQHCFYFQICTFKIHWLCSSRILSAAKSSMNLPCSVILPMGHVLCPVASYWLQDYPEGSKVTQAVGQDFASTALQYLLSSQQKHQSGVLAADFQPPETREQSYHSFAHQS